jgi:hypothetical protein
MARYPPAPYEASCCRCLPPAYLRPLWCSLPTEAVNDLGMNLACS